MTKQQILSFIIDIGIVPVVRTSTAEGAIHAIEAIHRGGVRAAEITMTVPGAIRALEKVADKFGDKIVLGAGTVLDPETARACMLAGAQFFVTPSLKLSTIEMVKQSGLRGRGGAGFPTGIKWKTVLGCEADQKYIVCNADEGDSGTFSDRMIMEGDPFALIEGMAIAGLAVGATKGYVYIRSEYPHAFRQMIRAIEIARQKNLLGVAILGSNRIFDMEARLGAGRR